MRQTTRAVDGDGVQAGIAERGSFPVTPAPAWLVSTALLLALLSAAGRFVNLDRRPYWHDEAFTSLSISGYRADDLRDAFDDRLHTVGDVLKYQQISADRGLLATAMSLATGDTHQVPLYYELARVWAAVFGDSPAAVRSASAAISLLSFPCVYWLCMEMFESAVAAWLGVALLALSPFHLMYAQEARSYALWTVITLLSTAVLLRAIRLQTRASWWLYAAILAAGLYTHLFFVLVMLAHGIYLAVVTHGNRSATRLGAPRPLMAYLRCIAIASIAFVPWVIVMLIKYRLIRDQTSWARVDHGLIELGRAWVKGLSTVFVDPTITQKFAFKYIVPIPLILLIAVAVYHLCRTIGRRVYVLVLAVMAASVLPLMLPDLIFGGRRSGVARYWTPCYLMIEVSVAWLLARGLMSARPLRRRIARGTAAFLMMGGAVSCVAFLQADTWWNKGIAWYDTHEIARQINRQQQPLLICSAVPPMNLGQVLALSHRLHPDVRILLLDGSELPDNFSAAGEVFALNPSRQLLENLKQATNRDMEIVDPSEKLRRLAEAPAMSSSGPTREPPK